jgi:hypothetical protein
MAVDRALPAQIFLDGEHIALARLFQTQQTATDCRDHLRLAANDPALVSRRGEVGDSQWAAIGPDDVVYAWTQLTVH